MKVEYSSLNYKDALSASGNKGVTKNYPRITSYNVCYTKLLRTTFDIVPYFDGILLQVPKPDNFREVNEVELQEKLFGIFKEHKKRRNNFV